MPDMTLVTACGLYCGDCEHLNDKCPGCGQVQGKPFWTSMFNLEVCPLYGCCVNQKKLEHCGLCPDLPCETFSSLRDPSMSDEEAAQSLQQKINDLKRRKEVGTKTWLNERH